MADPVADFDSVLTGLVHGLDGIDMPSMGATLNCTEQVFDESSFSRLRLPLLSLVEGPFTSAIYNAWLYAISWTIQGTLYVACDYANDGGKQFRRAVTDLHLAMMRIGGLPIDKDGNVVRYGPETAYRLDDGTLTFLVDRGGPALNGGTVTRLVDGFAKVTFGFKCDFYMSVDPRQLARVEKVVLGLTPLDPARLFVPPEWKPTDPPDFTVEKLAYQSVNPIDRAAGETPYPPVIIPQPEWTEPSPNVAALVVSPSSATVAAAGTQQLAAQATYEDGTTADVTMAATWASDATGAATVDAGLVTGVAAGAANITATLQGVTSDAALVTVT